MFGLSSGVGAQRRYWLLPRFRRCRTDGVFNDKFCGPVSGPFQLSKCNAFLRGWHEPLAGGKLTESGVGFSVRCFRGTTVRAHPCI